MTTITLPLVLVKRFADLLSDIARMKPGFEIYETAARLSKDLIEEMKSQKGMNKI